MVDDPQEKCYKQSFGGILHYNTDLGDGGSIRFESLFL